MIFSLYESAEGFNNFQIDDIAELEIDGEDLEKEP